MSAQSDSLTRGDLLRAIGAVRRSLPERATGTEALASLAREIEEPHACVPSYLEHDGVGPCEICAVWQSFDLTAGGAR